MEKFLSVKELAERFGVRGAMARRWCEQGKFPNARQIGRVWVVPESDTKNFKRPKRGRPKTIPSTRPG